MQTLTQILLIILGIAIVFILYRSIRHQPEKFSKENLRNFKFQTNLLEIDLRSSGNLKIRNFQIYFSSSFCEHTKYLQLIWNNFYICSTPIFRGHIRFTWHVSIRALDFLKIKEIFNHVAEEIILWGSGLCRQASFDPVRQIFWKLNF